MMTMKELEGLATSKIDGRIFTMNRYVRGLSDTNGTLEGLVYV